jgi:hypothetical protein
MIDTFGLLQGISLRDLIERDTMPAKNHRVLCPFCQAAHTGGPAMHIYADTFYCFGCGARGDAIDYIKLRDKVDFIEACKRLGWNGGAVDVQTVERMKAEHAARMDEHKQQRAAELDQMLAEYTADEIWGAYNRRMGADQIAWWNGRGIPRDWQEYLRLGYTPDKVYRDKEGELRHSPAYTIPYFHEGFTFQNIQYRLSDPENPKDRYRFEHGLKTVFYMTSPSLPIQDHVIVCEGAIKAIVAAIMGDTGDKVTILGAPSKTDWGGLVDRVKGALRVWLVFDPDAYDKPERASNDWIPAPMKLAQQIGKAARIVRLPVKSDDGFTQMGMSADEWKQTLRQSRAL